MWIKKGQTNAADAKESVPLFSYYSLAMVCFLDANSFTGLCTCCKFLCSAIYYDVVVILRKKRKNQTLLWSVVLISSITPSIPQKSVLLAMLLLFVFELPVVLLLKISSAQHDWGGAPGWLLDGATSTCSPTEAPGDYATPVSPYVHRRLHKSPQARLRRVSNLSSSLLFLFFCHCCLWRIPLAAANNSHN